MAVVTTIRATMTLHILVRSFVLFCVAPGIALAQSLDPIFESRGFQQNRDYFSQLPFEHIDTANGNLILTFTDLALPGNAGSLLRFQRTYNSKGGNGLHNGHSPWTFGLAGMVMAVRDQGTNPPPGSADPDVYLPKLATADGGEIQTIWMNPLNYTDPESFRWVVTSDFWKYDRTERKLYFPDGTRGSYDTSRRLTEIRDVFGNATTLTWTDGALTGVTQHLGNNQSRTVVFGYENGNPLPTTMTLGQRTWTYIYDQDGFGTKLLTSVRPPVGPSWRHGYDSLPNELTRITTPHGGTIAYTYDTYEFSRLQDVGNQVRVFSRVIKSRTLQERNGGTTVGTWSYDYGPLAASEQTTITNPDGSRARFIHGALGLGYTPELASNYGVIERLVDVPGTEGNPPTILERETREYIGLRVMEYGSVSRLKRRNIQRGGRSYETFYEYSTFDQHFHNYHRPIAIQETGERVRITQRTFDYSFSPSSFILGKLKTESVGPTKTSVLSQKQWSYDTTTGFLQETTVDGIRTIYAPDAFGNVGSETDGIGHTTSLSYSWGLPSTISTPKHTTVRSINAASTVASEQQGRQLTTFSYDGLFRITRTQRHSFANEQAQAVGNPVVTTYDNDAGASVTVTRGGTTSTSLDGFGRPIRIVSPDNVNTTFAYDALGRTTFKSNPTRPGDPVRGTSFTYDGLGRVTRVRNPDDSTATNDYQYGASGLTVTITDEANRTTVQRWIAYGDPDQRLLTSVVDADAKTWTYDYNLAGQLTNVTAPDALTRSWTYNDKLQLFQERHPESGTTTFAEYDAAGNLKQRTDANGSTFIYSYDENDRLTEILDPQFRTTITYEPGTDNRASITRTKISDPTKQIAATFDYDAVGRPTNRTDSIHGRTFATAYTHDGNDRIDIVQYHSGRWVQYAYNASDQITSVKDVTPGTVEFYYAQNLRYHPSGALESYLAGNGTTTTLTYHASRFWPTSVVSGPLLLTYDNYDKFGNVGRIQDPRTSGGGSHTQTFTYDAVHRLKTATSFYGSISFGYDAHGNRTSAWDQTLEYWPNTLRLKRLGPVEYTYDNNGNLRTALNDSYTYSPDNMMVAASAGGQATEYAYDGDLLRKLRVAGGQTSFYVHGLGSQLLSELTLQNNEVKALKDYVYANSRLIASVEPPSGLPPARGIRVAMTMPPDGWPFPGPATIGLVASVERDAAAPAILRVEFLNGSSVIGTGSDAGAGMYAYTWSDVAPGTYRVRARAITSTNQAALSAAITIIVREIGRVMSVSVAPSPTPQGQAATITVTGRNPCGAVGIDYGDGNSIVHAIDSLPWTHSYAWSSQGTKTVKATGHGNCANVVSTTVVVNEPNNQPTATLTSPTNGASFPASTPVHVAAAASDSDGIARVEFYSGTTLIGADTDAPYEVNWTNVAPGTYSLTAKATDNRGGTGVSTAVSITVTHLASVTVVPSPVAVGQLATVTVNGLGACGAIGLDYGDGTSIVYPTETLPFVRTYTWSSAGAKAVIATGHGNCTGQVSTTVNVNVNHAPSVSLTAPTHGASFVVPANVEIAANAADSDGNVARVDFYADDNLVGSDAVAPYAVIWNTAAAGTYVLTAKAIDNFGGTTTSGPVSISLGHLAAVSVSPSPLLQGQAATVTVSGGAGCGAVEINYGDGTVITYALTGLPHSQAHTWTSSGVKTVTARGQGNCVGQVSTSLTVNGNAPPTVQLTSPVNGATLIAATSVTVAAEARDPHGIAKVDFYDGSSLIGTATTEPHSITWNANPVGAHVLRAQATDVFGAVATSEAVSVTSTHLAGVSVPSPTIVQGKTVNVTVTGSPACGAVEINYGDGTVTTYALTGLPTAQPHFWAAPGQKTITARGQGNCIGQVSTTVNIVSNVPPSVTLTSPANGAGYTAPVTIALAANPSDSDGAILRVDYYAGADYIGSAFGAPWTLNWTNVGAGTYTIVARALDDSGFLSPLSNAATVYVSIGRVTGVSVSAAVQGQPAVVTVTGTNPCGAVEINFDDGYVMTYAIAGLPYSETPIWWSGGSKTVIARGMGNCEGQASTTIHVNHLPTVSIATPLNGSTFVAPASFPISATAGDADGSITKVEFYANGVYLGQDTSSPFEFLWQNVPAATFSLTARATDNTGLIATSAAISVTINTPGPSQVTSVAVSPLPARVGQAATITVYGTSPCGAVEINTGDGNSTTYATETLPYARSYTWTTAGPKTVIAIGHGNCSGQVSQSVNVVP